MDILLKISVAETQIILAALGKLPMETAIDVWSKIKSQAESQLQVAQAPANDATEATDPPSAA